jgi:Zn-dependent protease with chaperone function
MNDSDLGKLTGVYGLSAATLQRSIIVIIVSLFFSLAMLVGWLITQKFVLLMLAIAFLVIKLLSLFSLLAQRKNVLSLYEQGFIYNKISCRFDEIASVKGFEILTKSGGKVLLSETINDVGEAIKLIQIKAQV